LSLQRRLFFSIAHLLFLRESKYKQNKMKVRLLSSPLSAIRSQHHGPLQRSFTTSSPLCSNPSRPSPSSQASNSRWLSLTQARIGKCIMFGMNRELSAKAAGVLKVLATEWRDLVAGREGFLVDKKRAGLIGQKVVWGEMDVMVCLHPLTSPNSHALIFQWHIGSLSSYGRVGTKGEEIMLTQYSPITESYQQRNLHPLRRIRAHKLGLQLRHPPRPLEPCSLVRTLDPPRRRLDPTLDENRLQIPHDLARQDLRPPQTPPPA
jgi:hypothetical protein